MQKRVLMLMLKRLNQLPPNQKRGQATTTQIGMIMAGLVLAGIVILAFLGKTVKDLKGETYEKNYMARDIGLALDAVYAAPGDVEYTYSMKNYKYVVEIKNSMVLVKKEPGEEDKIAGVYDYFDGSKEHEKLNVRIIPNPDSDENKVPTLVYLGNRDRDVFVSAANAKVERGVVQNAAFA